MDGQMDTPSYRDARTHLKSGKLDFVNDGSSKLFAGVAKATRLICDCVFVYFEALY